MSLTRASFLIILISFTAKFDAFTVNVQFSDLGEFSTAVFIAEISKDSGIEVVSRKFFFFFPLLFTYLFPRRTRPLVFISNAFRTT